jgi:hypothetical protein
MKKIISILQSLSGIEPELLKIPLILVTIIATTLTRVVKKLERAEESIVHRRAKVTDAPDLGQQAASLVRDPRSQGRSQRSVMNLGRAITLPLDGNSAAAHPVVRGIAQAEGDKRSFRGETAEHCLSPGDFAQHGNARRIRSARAAGSARRKGSPWTGTPPSLT